MVFCQGIVGGRHSLFTVGAVLVTRPRIHEMEFIEVVTDVGIHLVEDLSGGFTQVDDLVGARDLEVLGVRDNGLTEALRVAPLVDVFRIKEPRAVVEIQKIIAFTDQFFQDVDDLVFHAGGGVLMRELPVHVSVGAPLVQDDGIEIGTGNHNEIPFLKTHVCIEVSGQDPSGFIPLNPADEHQGFPWVFSVYLVDV